MIPISSPIELSNVYFSVVTSAISIHFSSIGHNIAGWESIGMSMDKIPAFSKIGLCSLFLMLVLIHASFYLYIGGSSSGSLWAVRRLGVCAFLAQIKAR